MKLIALILSVVVLIAALSGLFYLSAKDISVTDSSVDSVSDLSLTGLTLNGMVTVYNGGFLPAGVENITYSVELEGIESIIGSGVLEGGVVKAGEEKSFPFNAKIEWVPSIDTALDLLFSEKTYANVEGTVNIVSFKFVKLSIPFTARVDLEGYIQQFTVGLPEMIPSGLATDVLNAVGDVIGTTVDVSGDVINYAINNSGAIVDAIGNFLS